MLVALPELCYEFDGDGTDEASLGPTMTGGTYSAGGKLGSALDGGATASVFADPATSVAGDVTVGFWFQQPPAAGSGTALIEIGNTAGGYVKFYTVCNAGTITQATVSSGNVVIALSSVISGWSHVVFQQSGTTVTVFINGSSVASGTIAIDSGVSGIVKFDATGAGLFDQFFIASRAMSASEIAYLYNSGDGLAYADMDVGTAPAAPTLAAPVASQASVAYALTPGSDGGLPITGYQVWRSDNGAAYYYYDNIDASATTYRVATGLWQYPVSLKIKAVNAAGASSFSNSQSVA